MSSPTRQRRRPTRAQKIENFREAERRTREIELKCERLKKWSDVHWTAFYGGSVRVEIYPCTLTLHKLGDPAQATESVDELLAKMAAMRLAIIAKGPDHD